MTMNPNQITSEISAINQSIIERTQQIRDLERAIKLDKAQLTKYYEEGHIPRNFKDDITGISATLQTKRTFKYSDAVELLKQEEVVNGIAEERMTQYWTVRANNV